MKDSPEQQNKIPDTFYPFNLTTIYANVPPLPAVYSLIHMLGNVWLYVADTDDVQTALVKHYQGDMPCIQKNFADYFSIELVGSGIDLREARKRQLLWAYNPICNRKQE